MVISTFLHDPVVHVVSAGALALLMGTAALHKLRDVPAFSQVLVGYGTVLGPILPRRLQGALAYLVPALELLAALGLLLCAWMPWAALPTALLLALYAVLLTASFASGRAIEDCGCHFGGRRQAPSPLLVWRNLLLLAPALNLLFPMSSRALLWFDALTLGVVLLGSVALYLLAHALISNRVSLQELR